MELTCQTPKNGDQTKEGRHVGLDFYDLLIEVLYRMRPKHSQCADRVGAAGRVRYSGLKEAAPGEAIMPIQSCWG